MAADAAIISGFKQATKIVSEKTPASMTNSGVLCLKDKANLFADSSAILMA
jgi:hypothetical protein